jgi:soluble lytic murein transglycosylase-like protein
VLAAYGSEVQKPVAPAAETAHPAQEVKEISAPPPRTEPVAQGSGSPAIASIISRASRRYGVDEGLIKAVIQVESNFKPTAVSHAGARGLMQLMPATAAGLGVTDSFNPEQNVMAGTRFLKDMLNRYGGDLDKALAAYNWGPGNLERGKGKLPRETQDYLVKVKKLYANNEVA